METRVPSRAVFHDRADAGRRLARSLHRYAAEPGVIVLGVPRGGVLVAREVARGLAAPLGVLVTQKIGIPGIEEVALGAIAEGSRRVVADDVGRYIGIPTRVVERLAARARVELERRVRLYRNGQPLTGLRGRTVIVVDDGLTTGATLRAAVRAARALRPRRVIGAVPVASSTNIAEACAEVDDLVTVVAPSTVSSVAAAYEHFGAVDDRAALAALNQPTRRVSPDVDEMSSRLADAMGGTHGYGSGHERTIAISVYGGRIIADLGLPGDLLSSDASAALGGARGLVILAHGAGSSRTTYRSRYLAGRLRMAGYATLRIDLLTRDEQHAHDGGPALPLEIDRVAARLEAVCDWVAREGAAGAHRILLVGTSSGAAAALVTAARCPERIAGVVAWGARVDAAASALAHVQVPVLMVVGTEDRDTLYRNADSLHLLPNGATLIKVPRTGSGFDAPGSLGVAGEHILSWFDRLESGPRRVLRWVGL